MSLSNRGCGAKMPWQLKQGSRSWIINSILHRRKKSSRGWGGWITYQEDDVIITDWLGWCHWRGWCDLFISDTCVILLQRDSPECLTCRQNHFGHWRIKYNLILNLISFYCHNVLSLRVRVWNKVVVFMCVLEFQGMVWHFWEIPLFTFYMSIRWEDWLCCLCDRCGVTASSGLSLALRWKQEGTDDTNLSRKWKSTSKPHQFAPVKTTV